jgi:hypothetical protein
MYSLPHSVILTFAGYHIYLGSLLPEPFLYYYVSALIIPVAILISSFALSYEVNQNWCRTKMNSLKKSKNVSTKSIGEGNRLLSSSTSSAVEVHNPYSRQISIHLHHWQIFYVLAFFTRFNDTVSQVGAGIVLACYMEGVCACKS